MFISLSINFHEINISKGKIWALYHLIQNHITLHLHMLQRYNPSNQTIHASWVGTFTYKVTKHICDMTWTNFRSSTNFPSLLREMRAVKSPASRIRILLHHSISISPNISSHPAADGRRSIFAQKHIFPFFCPFSGIPSATSLHLHPIPLHWPSFQTRSTCKPFNQHIPPFLGFSPEIENATEDTVIRSQVTGANVPTFDSATISPNKFRL